MSRRWTLSCAALTAMLLYTAILQAQTSLPPEVAKSGYADSIVVNGKIVSMDDQGYNANPGHIYEAMAIKGTRIMKLGSNEDIRALANKDTKVIDVGGRVVTPGIIDTHAHLFVDEGIAHSMGVEFSTDLKTLVVKAGKNLEDTRLAIENGIQGAVKDMQPGAWLVVGVSPNGQAGISAQRIFQWTTHGELEDVDRLTRVAPANPVELKTGTRAIVDELALKKFRELFPDFDDYEDGELPDVKTPTKSGIVGEGAHEALEYYLWYGKQTIPILASVVKKNWERAAAYGEVAFGSRVYNPRILDTATYLNQTGEAPIRFAMSVEVHRLPTDPDFSKIIYERMGNFTGMGNDMMWISGISSELWDSSFPLDCLAADIPGTSERVKVREMCRKPGDLYWEILKGAMESGWRLVSIHGVGSDGTRRFTQMLEQVKKEEGWTSEDIRKLRPTQDHNEAEGNVPDVIAKVKDLGIIFSVNPARMVKEPDYVQDYGPEAEKFIMPVKSWLDEGVNVVGEFEGYTSMGTQFYRLITRDIGGGHIVLPDQKLDRVTVLKMWTTWAPRYFMKEDVMGTLEPGKFADYIVLNKDYFTIPVNEIPTITPQMTVVGGKIRALQSDFAKTLGIEAVGYQFAPDFKAWGAQAGGGGAGQ